MASIDDVIVSIETEIADLQEQLTRKKEELQRVERNKKYQHIEAYKNKHGEHPQDVIREYVRFLDQHSYQGGKGYKVSCPGYNPGHLKSHWVLVPEHREKCLPSEKVTEALSVYGHTATIAEQPHYETWGN
jgi:hypothetical protein